MVADQRQRRGVHRLGVERPADLPRPAGIERKRRAPVDDPIAVAPLDGGETGVEAVVNGLGIGHRDGPGFQMVVQRLSDAERFGVARDVEVDDLRQRMDAGIGPAGREGDDLLAAEFLDCFFQALLDRQAVVLALPADERTAVVFQGELEASGHDRTVPGGMAKPRSNSAAAIGALP